MIEENANQKSAIDDVSADLRRTGYVFIPLMGLGVLAIVFKAGSTAVVMTYLMWALSCLLSGAAVGFLFGIPKILQSDRPEGAAQAEISYRQQVNTNLEQISDWLTKIIVGLGLVNLTNLPPHLSRIAGNLAAGTGDGENISFALALIVYFALLGFLSGYLSTRLFLAGAFSKADQLAAARQEGRSRGVEQTIDQLKALAKQLDPRLFRQVVNEIRPEALVDGNAPAGAATSPPASPPAAAGVEDADVDEGERERLERELRRINQIQS